MGVLKNLTDEYFKKILRTEDGKYANLAGHRVIIPVNFNADEFLEKFKKPGFYFFYTKEHDKQEDENHIMIRGGEKSVVDLQIYNWKTLCKHNFIDDSINEKMFNSFVNLLKEEMSEIEIDEDSNSILCRERNLDELFKDTDFTRYDYIPIIMGEFDSKFKKLKSKRSKNVCYRTLGENSCIVIPITSMSAIQIESIVYSSMMRKWFSDKIEKIKKVGPKEYIAKKKKI